MPHIAIARQIPAGVPEVWAAISDIACHPGWMSEIEEMTFETPERTGVGVIARVRTKVGPLRTDDIMKITSWIEGESLGVDHIGLVKGSGVLAVTGDDQTSTVTWTETLRFPWWLGGAFTGFIARPILARIWKKNLDRLARIHTPS